MGTFSKSGNEYDNPTMPAEYTGRNTRKAFMRGWLRGIWTDRAAGVMYRLASLQRAYEAGHALARATRRERGEQF